MRRDTQAVLLLLVGGALLKISFTGSYVRYVRAGLLPLLLATGAVLVAIAGITLWQVMRRTGPPVAWTGGAARTGSDAAQPRDAASPPPDHRSVRDADAAQVGHAVNAAGAYVAEPASGQRAGWLLLLAVMALLLLAPPAVGSYQANRHGTALSRLEEPSLPEQSSLRDEPLPDGDPVRLSLLDYGNRAVLDQGRSLTGRRILLSGFVIAGPGGQPYLARMVVGCCAADARPVKIGLAGDVPGDLQADEWIEVVGTYTQRSGQDPLNGAPIPYIQVAEFRAIRKPKQQYES